MMEYSEFKKNEYCEICGREIIYARYFLGLGGMDYYKWCSYCGKEIK